MQTPQFDQDQHRVREHPGGPLLVLGGAGTGKSTAVAALAAQRITSAGPGAVLVLVGGREAQAAMRQRLRADPTGPTSATGPTAATGPADGEGLTAARQRMVRTVHSYAFGVLRLHAQLRQEPPPRLLSGAEQDAVVRELLHGEVERGATRWPEPLRPALRHSGFAQELRNLLLRVAERGMGPADLQRLGRRHGRPEWEAAGRFFGEYEQVLQLTETAGRAGEQRSGLALDAAELVAAAVSALESDERLLADQRAQLRHIVVDDAQHLDPVQFRLLSLLGEAATDWVLCGDPDQGVFGFRGAERNLLPESDPDGSATVILRTQHRMSAELARDHAGVIGALPGAPPYRTGAHADGHNGPVDTERPHTEPVPAAGAQVQVFSTQSREAFWVADQLLRAHVQDGVEYREMAVILRSPGAMLPALRRAMASAGVAVNAPGGEIPLARHHLVAPMLSVLRVVQDPAHLSAELAGWLLTGPLGGMEPMTLRRLRRELLASARHRGQYTDAGSATQSVDARLCALLLHGEGLDELAEETTRAARRLHQLLRRACGHGTAAYQLPELVYQLWQHCELEESLVRLSERGGPAGAQADTDLDVMIELLRRAEDFAARLPGSRIGHFADQLEEQLIGEAEFSGGASAGDGVTVLTAHASVARQWRMVVICGVQEGSWPNLVAAGSVLGAGQLRDVLRDRPAEGLSQVAPVLAEERRLFALAAGRARERLIVTAVSSEDAEPSRFLRDLTGDAELEPRGREPVSRPLTSSALVGQLRRAVCGDGDPETRSVAAEQLALLARAGVRGADPDSWWGLRQVSTRQPLVGQGAPVALSPSTVERLVGCPLRWLLQRHGGEDQRGLAAVTGSMVHAAAQALAEGETQQRVQQVLARTWEGVDAGAPWYARHEQRRIESMVEAFRVWLRISSTELEEIRLEHPVRVELPAVADEPAVRLTGVIDRVQADEDGRAVVVDLKTSRAAVSKADAEAHPQLSTYQLAVHHGALADLGLHEPGGARLVYVAKTDQHGMATERMQPPLDDATTEAAEEQVREAARSSMGPEFMAHPGPECARCPVRQSCPAQLEGRQVTQTDD